MAKINVDQLRNLIFGAEDSIVSTMGVLFGTAATNNYSSKQIIMVGLILIVVEALSMGMGSYLSEASALEQKPNKFMNPIADGIIMFISYFLTGILIVLPYYFLPITSAKYISVALAVMLLFALGFLPKKSLKSAFRMVTLASLALVVSYLVGSYLDSKLV